MQMAMEPDSQPAVVVPPQVYPVAQARPTPGREPEPVADPPRQPPPPPGVLAVLGHGARRVMGQPRLLLFVWGLSMLTAMVASLPAMVVLGMLLGKRPAAAAIARGQADYLFGELFGDHPVSAAITVGSVLAAAALFFLLQLVLSGGLLSALRRPGDPQRVGPALSPIIARGLSTAAAMVRVELWFVLLVRVPLTLAGGALLAVALRGKFIDNHTVAEILWRLGPLAGLLLWLWCIATIVQHATRLARLGQTAGESSDWRALVAGVKNTLGRPALLRVTLTLGFTAAAGMVGLVVAGRVLAARLDYALWVTVALVIRQSFALLRSALTLGIMAGTVELCTRRAD